MHIFLTGGSGYIGRNTIPALLAAGHDVSALARSEEAAATVAGLGATPVRGALTDAEVLRGAAAAADGVIHLGSTGDADSATVDRAAAAALLAGAGENPYVHTGGAWVYGTTTEPVGEDAPQSPPAIVSWRAAVEAEVLGRAAQGGRPVLVMPAVVYGQASGLPQYALVETGRADSVVHTLGDGANHWPLVHAEDIADLYVRALAAAPGARYLGVTESQTQQALAEALTRAPGNPDRVEAWPVEAATEALGPLAEPLLLDQHLSAARAERELGWAPRHTDALATLAAG